MGSNRSQSFPATTQLIKETTTTNQYFQKHMYEKSKNTRIIPTMEYKYVSTKHMCGLHSWIQACVNKTRVIPTTGHNHELDPTCDPHGGTQPC